MKRLEYKEFTRHLEQEGYTPTQTAHLFWEIKKMSPKVRGWFLEWFHCGEYPKDVVEGVTVQMLVEEAELKPVNAFIAIDWLLKDPDAAKFALTHVKHLAVLDENNVPDVLPEEPDEVICGD